MRQAAVVCAVVVAFAAYATRAGGLFHHPVSGTKVADAAGATYCDDTGYLITNRLDHSRTKLWACGLPYGVRCVTYTDGLARNVTVEVRLLWAGTLGANRPDCLA